MAGQEPSDCTREKDGGKGLPTISTAGRVPDWWRQPNASSRGHLLRRDGFGACCRPAGKVRRLSVAALNQDVQTFDNMVAALHFHMYQPVILANMGEYGGSTAQAPLRQHERLIAHVHGVNQVAVSVFEVDPTPFKSTARSSWQKNSRRRQPDTRGVHRVDRLWGRLCRTVVQARLERSRVARIRVASVAPSAD
jgi:hypothetical protein